MRHCDVIFVFILCEVSCAASRIEKCVECETEISVTAGLRMLLLYVLDKREIK